MGNRRRVSIRMPAAAGLAGTALAALLCTATAAHAASAISMPTAGRLLADHIVVRKAAHMLYLYHGKQLLDAYHIELGLDPVGQKEREDDFRTPEGHYRLERRNPRSEYFLSIQVSYPNARDEERAKRHHWSPGGEIMIHGTPNSPRYPAAYYAKTDWTNGCIALSNSDMVELWMRTGDDVPIDIYP
jgi:murein L,D-transpeptidase YafK